MTRVKPARRRPSVDGDASRGRRPLRPGLILIRSNTKGCRQRLTGLSLWSSVRRDPASAAVVRARWCQSLMSAQCGGLLEAASCRYGAPIARMSQVAPAQSRPVRTSIMRCSSSTSNSYRLREISTSTRGEAVISVAKYRSPKARGVSKAPPPSNTFTTSSTTPETISSPSVARTWPGRPRPRNHFGDLLASELITGTAAHRQSTKDNIITAIVQPVPSIGEGPGSQVSATNDRRATLNPNKVPLRTVKVLRTARSFAHPSLQVIAGFQQRTLLNDARFVPRRHSRTHRNATDFLGSHPVCRRPTHRGAGVVQGVKVERPAGRTTLTPWAAPARLCLGRRQTGWGHPTHATLGRHSRTAPPPSRSLSAPPEARS